MTNDFKVSLVKYRSLKTLYSLSGVFFSKKYLKKAKEDVVSQLDEVLNFEKLYSILKPIENEDFGFYITPSRNSLRGSTKMVMYQYVEVGVNINGRVKFIVLDDYGYGKKIVNLNANDYANCNKKVEISPKEIVSISKINILEAIKEIDKRTYKYAFTKVIEALFSEIGSEYEEKLLLEIVAAINEKYADFPREESSLSEYEDKTLCIEKEEEFWVVYESVGENKDSKEKYSNVCEACLGVLKKIEKHSNASNLQYEFIEEIFKL